MQRESMFREMKLRGPCAKSSETRTREKAKAMRKLIGKRLRQKALPARPKPTAGPRSRRAHNRVQASTRQPLRGDLG
jgi:hypothetical protein